ncbi:HAMP domain-containing protein [Eubacteriaceae bacterium ES3]|nr:HAMP domain-containing protein [Eubacteriaceae bacterium ES3]
MKQSEKVRRKPLTLSAILVKNLVIAFLTGILAFIFFVFIPDLSINQSIYYFGGAVFSGGLGCLIFLGLTSRRITYLRNLKTGSLALAEGKKTTPLRVEGNDELADISRSINSLYQQLDTQTRSIDHLKSENRQLITSISNELYPLITTLNGYLERMQKDPDADMHYLQTIQKKAVEIQHFVEDVLNDAFSDNQSTFYEFKLYDGLPLIDQFIEKITPVLSEAGFEIVVENCLDQPFSLWIDNQQLSRITSELTGNIIKFADQEKPIHLGLIRNKNEVLMILRNKTLPYAKEALKPESDSLQLCQRIIERHHGRIDYYHLNQMFKVEMALPIHSNTPGEST